MKPLVTVALVAANLAAFALELVGGVEPTCEAWGFTPAHFTIVGLLTSTYLHAGWGTSRTYTSSAASAPA